MATAHGTLSFANDSTGIIFYFECIHELGRLQLLIDVQLVLNVQELLQDLSLFLLTDFILLFKGSVKLLLKCLNLQVMFVHQVIELDNNFLLTLF